MGPSTIMIIRHAEKPGIYNKVLYNGINAVGQQDAASLVTMGWERAGGIASLFDPRESLQAGLPKPDFIYASNPVPSPAKYKTEPNGNIVENLTSQRPYQTISALSAKLKMSSPNLNTSFVASDYHDMVADVLKQSGTVLIAWQHQYILPHAPGDDSIIYELFCQTNTINVQLQEPIPASFGVPAQKWPSDRYDMVFVLELSSAGLITSFTQVPQKLLAGDSKDLFS